MEDKSQVTYNKLLSSGKKFFLSYGYKSAPLRKIVADAGFTSGAFYGYFDTKLQLFYALTDSTAETFINLLAIINSEINKIPVSDRLLKMNSVYVKHIPSIVDFILQNKDIIILILAKSEGTKYENFIESLAMQNIKLLTDNMLAFNNASNKISPFTLQTLITGYFSMLKNVAIFENDREKMISCMSEISQIIEKGIISLLNN